MELYTYVGIARCALFKVTLHGKFYKAMKTIINGSILGEQVCSNNTWKKLSNNYRNEKWLAYKSIIIIEALYKVYTITCLMLLLADNIQSIIKLESFLHNNNNITSLQDAVSLSSSVLT